MFYQQTNDLGLCLCYDGQQGLMEGFMVLSLKSPKCPSECEKKQIKRREKREKSDIYYPIWLTCCKWLLENNCNFKLCVKNQNDISRPDTTLINNNLFNFCI